MNRMQAWSGMFAVPPSEGIVSPDYSVFTPTTTVEITFFEHLFKTPILVEQFARESRGIGSGFNRLYSDDFGNIAVALPPLPNRRPSSAIWTTPTCASGGTSAPRGSSLRCWRRRSRPLSIRPSLEALTLTSASSPPASTGLATCRRIGLVRTLGQAADSFRTGPFGSMLHQSDYVESGTPVINPVHMGMERLLRTQAAPSPKLLQIGCLAID